MSKSYKKVPIVKDGNSKKPFKKYANRKVRSYIKRVGEFPQNGTFKKIFEQYEITDNVSYCSEKEWRDLWYKGQSIDAPRYYYEKKYSLEEWMQIWKGYYRNK